MTTRDERAAKMQKSTERRRISDDDIVAAGAALGLTTLTVRGVAEYLGVSEMTIYRRTGGLEGLRRAVANGIVERAPLPLPRGQDPEQALLEIACSLRDFVIAHPGIAAHLVHLDSQDAHTLDKIEASQRAFAEHFGWTPAQSSLLLSVVAEHAVALAQLNPLSHQRARTDTALQENLPTIRAGAAAVAELTPQERFAWSMRATIRGALLTVTGSEAPFPTEP